MLICASPNDELIHKLTLTLANKYNELAVVFDQNCLKNLGKDKRITLLGATHNNRLGDDKLTPEVLAADLISHGLPYSIEQIDLLLFGSFESIDESRFAIQFAEALYQHNYNKVKVHSFDNRAANRTITTIMIEPDASGKNLLINGLTLETKRTYEKELCVLLKDSNIQAIKNKMMALQSEKESLSKIIRNLQTNPPNSDLIFEYNEIETSFPTEKKQRHHYLESNETVKTRWQNLKEKIDLGKIEIENQIKELRIQISVSENDRKKQECKYEYERRKISANLHNQLSVCIYQGSDVRSFLDNNASFHFTHDTQDRLRRLTPQQRELLAEINTSIAKLKSELDKVSKKLGLLAIIFNKKLKSIKHQIMTLDTLARMTQQPQANLDVIRTTLNENRKHVQKA